MVRRKVIFDTDPGVDDATALLYLLADPGIELVGITTVWGNASVDTTTRNALYLKERFAIPAPVARGAGGPVSGDEVTIDAEVHGDNGLGNIVLPETIRGDTDPRPAHRFIADTLRAHPGEVTILAVGPFSNLALMLHEDAGLASLAAQVVVMGGAFGINGHLGNVTPAAEANVWHDPEAADAVFAADWPVTVIGLDVTMEVVMATDYLADLRERAGDAGALTWEITRAYAEFYRRAIGIDGIVAHDSLAAAVVTAPDLMTTRGGPVRVVTEGFARGQTIQKPDTRRFGADHGFNGRRTARIATGVDAKAFLALYAERLEAAFGGR